MAMSKPALRLPLSEPALVATNAPPINAHSIAGEMLLTTASEHDGGGANLSFRERRRFFSDHSLYFTLSSLARRHNAPHAKRDNLLRFEIERGDL
jgi:hypothetical protein